MSNRRWKRLSNMLTSQAMLMLSDRMAANDEANPGVLPDLSKARTLAIVTDMSGTRSDPYEVYSFLITDHDRLSEWETARTTVRTTHLADGRRMSYKGLSNDALRQNALRPFLAAADSIHGLLFSVAIDTRLPSVFADPKQVGAQAKKFGWKPLVFERLLRVMHFNAFLLAGLSRRNQNVLWICDEDAILANAKMARDVELIMPSVWAMYVSHTFGRGGFLTTAADTPDRQLEDLSAIPDLAAGAAFEQFRQGPIPVTRKIKVGGRSEPTLAWLASKTGELAKLFVHLVQPPDKVGVQIDWLNFEVSATT